MRRAFFLTLLVFFVGCESPAGPIVYSKCLEPELSDSVTNSDDLRDYLLERLNASSLSFRDFSDEFRRLESNERLVRIEVRDRSILPRFRALIILNSSNGDSMAVANSSHSISVESFVSVIEEFAEKYSMVMKAPNDYGGCSNSDT